MTKFEEGLIRLREEELFGKRNSIKVEGSDFMGNMGEIGKTVQDIIDGYTSKGYILCEDLDFFDETQMDCIKQLGDILAKLDEY